MICWSITAHAVTHPDDGILDAGAGLTYVDAHQAAGDAALAALAVIAAEQPRSIPFVTIRVEDTPLLLACAATDDTGAVDLAALVDAVVDVRDTGATTPLSTTPWFTSESWPK